MSGIEELTVVIILIWNVVTFVIMGIDKSLARKKAWRISERALLISAFLMGAVGSILGALTFRHKTRKLKFRILLPVAFILNVLTIVASGGFGILCTNSLNF